MNSQHLTRFLITLSVLTLTACNGGGGGGGDESSGSSSVSDDSTSSVSDSSSSSSDSSSSSGSGSTSSSTTATFDVSDAVALIANEDLVEESTSASMVFGKSSGKPLFTYRIKKPGSASFKASETTSSDGSSSTSDGADTSGGTNLLAVDEDGNAKKAINSSYPIKVMYTTASPDGDHVYLALDNGWFNWDGNDYAQFIAANNCALFQVSVSDNDFECLAEGLYVQNMDDSYMKAVSGDQKPIQFDNEGNMYFAANSFEVESDSWCEQWEHDENGIEVCVKEQTNYWINSTEWNPRIYKRDVATGEVTALTQDNEDVEFFLVLPNGEVAFQSWNMTNAQSQLSMLQNDQKIDLTGSTWGVDFFTVDSDDTVIFGQGDWSGSGNNGLRFASPRAGGGVEKASLDTSLFGADATGRVGGWGNPKPRRIVLGDDGRVYGVFEGGRDNYNDSGEWESWTQVLTVYQMLPYDGVPKVALTIANNDWWAWMSETPFQIAKGYLYYVETVDVEFFGTADVIRMLNLTTRETTTLLDPTAEGGDGARYDIYNWRLSDNIIYFSGLNKNGNIVVTGKLDTVKVRDDLVAEALTVNETASALGAASAIQDIEIIKPRAGEVDTGSEPVVTKVHQDMDNLYSMSVDFSKYMDKETVESNISLMTLAPEGPSSDGVIPSMKVWLYKTLHLIPDLDGLGNSAETTPLTANTQYTLSFGSGMRDIYDWDLAVTESSSVTMRPNDGWYVGNLLASADENIASTNVLRYAGPAEEWTLETFDLGTVPVNLRVEFSAKNMGWEGLQLLLWDNETSAFSSWEKILVRYRLSSWTELEYKVQSEESWLQGEWKNANTPNLFNGNFQRYRVEIFGNNLKLSYSDDGVTFTEVESMTQSNLLTRTGSDYKLLVRVREALQLDNLVISTLDSSGNLASSAGDILNESFDSGMTTPAAFVTDVTQTYELENW